MALFVVAYTVAQVSILQSLEYLLATFSKEKFKVTNYKGDSGLPWWTLTVLLIMTFILTVLYGFLASVSLSPRCRPGFTHCLLFRSPGSVFHGLEQGFSRSRLINSKI